MAEQRDVQALAEEQEWHDRLDALDGADLIRFAVNHCVPPTMWWKPYKPRVLAALGGLVVLISKQEEALQAIVDSDGCVGGMDGADDFWHVQDIARAALEGTQE